VNLNICHREACDPVLELEPLLVRCRNCGLAGPVGRSLDESVNGWNGDIDRRNAVVFARSLVDEFERVRGEGIWASVPSDRYRHLAEQFLKMAEQAEKTDVQKRTNPEVK
jgi:hypothetical protein